MRHQKLSQTKKTIAPKGQREAIANNLENAIAPSPTQTPQHSPHPIEKLQGSIGNRAVNQLLAGEPLVQTKPLFRGLSHELAIQPKLTIGAVGDQHKQEAHVTQKDELISEKAETSIKGINPSRIDRENKTGLPDNLKTGIENLSGMGMDDVKIHYNSSKPSELQALAYAQGTNIHVAPGQEKHLPHEAWHVVQQKQGKVKPSFQLKSGIDINDSPQLENEANVMGAKAQSIGATVYKKEQLTQPPKIKSPITSGSTQQLKSDPGFQGSVIQKVNSHDTWGGKFSVEKYESVRDRSDGISIGADIRIVFTPNQNCPKNVTIGLIQIVKLIGANAYSSELQRKLMNQQGPWAVDRAEDANPVYGSYDTKDHKSKSLTDNPPSDKEGNQFGKRVGRRGRGGQPATLEDTPVLPLRTDIKQGQYFETTALVLEGPQTGLALGTVGWGWTKPAGEKAAICEPFTLIEESGRTANFEQAKDAWNALADREELVTIPNAPRARRGGCFLTTACVEYMGLGDDCEELTSLRQFRDTYLLQKTNGQELIKLYYEYSPEIVAAIHKQDNEEEILKDLYKIIRQCVDSIKKGDNEWAYQTYCKMVMVLKDEFIPEYNIATMSY